MTADQRETLLRIAEVCEDRRLPVEGSILREIAAQPEAEGVPNSVMTNIRQDDKGHWNIPLTLSTAAILPILGDRPHDGMPVLVTLSIIPLTLEPLPKPATVEGEVPE